LVVAGNRLLVVNPGGAAPAVNGNSGGASLSTDPFANFTY